MINTRTKSKILAFALLIAAVLLFSACDGEFDGSSAAGQVYITEVVTSNSRSLIDDTLGTPDWIELYNAGSKDVNLKGYTLSDNMREIKKWIFPDVIIKAGEYLIIYASSAEGELCTGFGLSKSGEYLFFADNYLTLLQQLEIPALQRDVSYARTEDGRYGYCAAPTPGAANNAPIVFAESDLVFAFDSTALKLSEVLPNNASYPNAKGNYTPWMEIINTADEPVLLSDYYISDDANNLEKWKLPALVLESGRYAVIYFTGEGDVIGSELHASFNLGSDDTALYITDQFGTRCDMFTWPQNLPDDVAVLAGEAFTAHPTPGEVNSSLTFENSEPVAMDASDPLRVNEVLVRNRYSLRDADGDRSAWVELHNYSQNTVSLRGYYLSDNPNNPYKWALPDITLLSGEYYLIFLSGKDKHIENELHAPFSLSRNDEALLFTCADGLRQDYIPIDPNIAQNVSIGLYENGEYKYFSSPTPRAGNSTHSFATSGEVVFTDTGGVYISEVCASTKAQSSEANWIELYNPTPSTVTLDGWYLSDDPDEPQKFSLAGQKIASKGYLVVNATTRTSKTSGLCAPFGISDGGETLVLTNANGEFADVFETGAVRYGITSGRVEGDASATRVFFNSATKGKKNDADYEAAFVNEPVFGETALYHEAPFALEITCTTPGASIYYTLDGSTPTQLSNQYTGAITISANAPVRAVAFASGMHSSNVACTTFLFETPHTLPVVCITADPVAFAEVYAATIKAERVEREGHFAFYETDSLLGTSFPCGLRAAGASTLKYAQKSLTVTLRSAYGCGESNYPFFEDSDVGSYKSLVLRNSGQDNKTARVRDSFFARVVKGLNIETVETRLAVLYVNGDYRGIYDLNENQNEDYMAAHYGVDPDAVDIIRRNISALEGSNREIKRLQAYAFETDLSVDANYQQYIQWVDVDYFTDYLVAQTYFSNGDMFNQKYWRSQDYSMKWRPVFFDLDLGFSSSSPSRNILKSYFNHEGVPSQDGTLTNMSLFAGLRENEAWCKQFCERYVYIVTHYFAPERMIGILDEMADDMRAEIPRHAKRWNGPSLSFWENNIASLRKCIEERPEYALKYLKAEFNLTDAQMQAYVDAANANPPW